MYAELKEKFRQEFGAQAQYIFSAPGRTEISGNHTDHQHGCVLAAAVDRQTVAAVAENGTMQVRLRSEGYALCEMDLNDLSVHPEEAGRTAALIRGVAAQFAQFGLKGFDAYVVSNVLSGSGLSSSAAFEVLMGVIFNELTGAGFDPVQLARIGQYAENVYFGKPCGLMDQMACSVGNMIFIDFADSAATVVEPIAFDFGATGHSLCIIDSGASHADMTDEYAAITEELKAVCAVFGKAHLREIPEEDFYEKLAAVRAAAGDRAVCRAIHVYEENKRVAQQVQALKDNDFAGFLQGVRASGCSSWRLLQNVIPAGRKERQEVALALALAEKLLCGKGACRVHGGGFAGTIQAFVPDEMVESFTAGMDKVLGKGACQVMAIAKAGGSLVEN